MEIEKKQLISKILMEFLWWLFTIIAAFFIVQPLWKDFKDDHFIYQLLLYIIVFITYSRYLFFLKFTFLAYSQKIKVLLVFISLPLAFYLGTNFFDLQSFLDKQSEGMVEYQSFFRNGISDEQRFVSLNYLTKMYTFFGVSAIIAVIVSPFRLLVSYWRVYNKTGKV